MNLLARLGVCATCIAVACGAATAADAPGDCSARIAQWLNPANGAVVAPAKLFDRVAGKSIVLLGEVHDNPGHHQWQHYTMAALHSRNPAMVVGLEMLPRRLQSALDGWSAGRLDEAEFLEQSEWNEVWGYDPDLYLPILRFARQHRLPGIALNVDRQLVSKVGAEGWNSLNASERMGLSDPAPASADYRRQLGELYAYKMTLRDQGGDAGDGEPGPGLEQVMQSDAFANFVDAQLTWDRAMAEALASAHRLDPAALIVAIVGRGHIEHGYGIPHQLADMGVDDVAVLLPIDAAADCGELPADLANAVFVVETHVARTPAPRPRLGVMIEDRDSGVRVMEVVDDSVAAAAGIQAGDLIQLAAGFEVTTTRQLIDVIQRQAPGTWLPITLSRDGETHDLVARFPQGFD